MILRNIVFHDVPSHFNKTQIGRIKGPYDMHDFSLFQFDTYILVSVVRRSVLCKVQQPQESVVRQAGTLSTKQTWKELADEYGISSNFFCH